MTESLTFALSEISLLLIDNVYYSVLLSVTFMTLKHAMNLIVVSRSILLLAMILVLSAVATDIMEVTCL